LIRNDRVGAIVQEFVQVIAIKGCT